MFHVLGAFAVYLEPWHADIFEFLDLRKNHGKVLMVTFVFYLFNFSSPLILVDSIF